MGRIIAIANQKGGVGKTTTAVNLGACLAAAGRTVLLVDLDPQGNATSGVGLGKEEVDRGVYNSLCGDADWENLLRSTEVANLDVLPSTRDLTGASIELVEVERRESCLRDALIPLRDEYDFTLIDCPPSLGLLTLNALTAAGSVLVPLQCEYYALEGVSELMSTLELVKEELNPGLVLEGILLTMYDSRNNLSRQVQDEVRDFFHNQVFEAVIPRNVRLSEAPSFGRPILLYDLQSKGSQAYLMLSQEILARDSGTTPGKAAAG